MSRLTGAITTFLTSLHDAKPDFGLIGLPEAEKLPRGSIEVTKSGKAKVRKSQKTCRTARGAGTALSVRDWSREV